MKRLLSVLLVVCLIVSSGICVPAHAEEIPPDAPDQTQGQPQEGIPVEVSTLEELQEALVTVENGDTIAISSEILLDGVTVGTEKEIAITRSDSYLSGTLFRMRNGARIDGFVFEGSKGFCIVSDNTPEIAVEIANCKFIGQSLPIEGSTFISLYNTKVTIDNCSFEASNDTAIQSKPTTTVTIRNSIFKDNQSLLQGGAIHNTGTVVLENCTISNNRAVSGGGIYNGGNLFLIDCKVYGNTVESKKFGTDILSFGTLSITDMLERDAEYYEESTGARIDLPLVDCSNTAKLVYLTEQQAEEYFAPAPAPEPTDPPELDDEDDGDTPPYDQTPPAQPETPSEPQAPGEGEDTPAEDQEPTEQPETPPEDEPDEEDTYTPPVVDRPTYRPPVIIYRPQEPAEPPAPALACGEAAIDTSRSVILEGYGDGQLHLEDTLSRAQMATIIYRLLDADSIEKYDTGEEVFADVPADAWHFRYVTTIANAGIVCGIGDDRYNPDGKLTWAQIITVLSRFVEAEEYELQTLEYDGWARSAVETAVALGWIEDGNDIDLNSTITRGEFVEFVNSVIEKYR